MRIKDFYNLDEIYFLLFEFQDLGVDIDELPLETTLEELVRLSNRLRNV